jgi:ATP-dependent DNA helicase RecG
MTEGIPQHLRPFVDELKRVLLLEQECGYIDGVVYEGCLNDYLAIWSERASALVKDAAGARVLSSLRREFVDYTSLDLGAREKWVGRMLRALEKTGSDSPASARIRPPARGLDSGEGRNGGTMELNCAPRGKGPNDRVGADPPSRAGEEGRGLGKPHTKAAAVSKLRSLDDPVTYVPGVGSSLATKLGKVDVHTVRDLLYYFPFRYVDGSQFRRIAELRVGEIQSLQVEVWQVRTDRRWGRQHAGSEAIVGDDSGNMRILWFNNPYPAKTLKTGQRIVITGKVDVFGGQRQMVGPDYQVLGHGELVHVGRIIPIYHCGGGLSEFEVRRAVKAALNLYARAVEDPLPPRLLRDALLMDLPDALCQIHFPDDQGRLAKARRRLAFDELFYIQLGVMQKRREWREDQQGVPMPLGRERLAAFLDSLPFVLTASQHRALEEILADMATNQPMTRLLQGEVGSGKTVVAAAALLAAVANGYQGVLMAPTEILAEQHFRSLQPLLGATQWGAAGLAAGTQPLFAEPATARLMSDRPIAICLLTGSLRKGEREALRRAISKGEIDVVVGTHAIIQEGVEFARLGLSIVDEQHRFGVMQRSALRQKGFNPHLLVMTATPIPRTLALTMYGDLDLSAITELPPGRRAVRTYWLKPTQRRRAYDFIRKQVAEGRQAFIVCPLVEESDKIEAKAATVEFERLSREVFPDLSVGLLHGRMTGAEKDAVMARFRDDELDVLVSTAVIEVGIDVPNASVMLVEGADRFGLSQLHQFRGRVGRGAHESYCLLLSDSPSDDGKARLAILEQTNDGFKLAEEDLRLRGPGEFFGTRQSGLPDLRMARLSDIEILEQARELASILFKVDPFLEQPQHRLIRERMRRFWQGATEELS